VDHLDSLVFQRRGQVDKKLNGGPSVAAVRGFGQCCRAKTICFDSSSGSELQKVLAPASGASSGSVFRSVGT
jgi:hypothetical protein